MARVGNRQDGLVSGRPHDRSGDMIFSCIYALEMLTASQPRQVLCGRGDEGGTRTGDSELRLRACGTRGPALVDLEVDYAAQGKNCGDFHAR